VRNPDGLIRGAGGVLWRTGEREPEVALIHRPRYDDWTFPKGKTLLGESDTACALREVHEETGLRCELSVELPSSEYVDRKGRAKVVRYWIMRPLSGQFQPNKEVDELRWRPLGEAKRLLSYERDRELLAAAAEVLIPPGASPR
jgi:8-oxo-dGTP diphosphatase